MWGRYSVTWDAGQELDEIRKARKYGTHLHPGDGNEGAFQFRKQRTEGNNTASGNKILEYAGGDTYDGEVQQGLKHGVGKYVWANGARYEGDWRKNVPHGSGKYSWPDGESYEGRFKQGRRDGSGIYVFANGASFVGVFRDDLAHGKGICTLPGGRCFHGDFRLFAAYLRTAQTRGSKVKGDRWPPFHWDESSDLLRNPPWRGYTAVRAGRRHYEDGFSSMPSLDAAPAVTPKVFSVEWPHAVKKAEALDLHTPSTHRPPRRVGREWPFVSAIPRRHTADGDDEQEEQQEEVRWSAGDVGECSTLEGVPLDSIGIQDTTGRLTGLPPGLWFKVRVDEVENVWPGFNTEGISPLVICKVVYVGLERERQPEWVPSWRLRKCMATRNEDAPMLNGWMVTDGAIGEYRKDRFVPTENAVQVGDTIECLFAFSGSTTRSKLHHTEEVLAPPRLFDVAAADAADYMLAACDPEGGGLWQLATPDVLRRVARVLARCGKWDLLSTRVLGSVSFMTKVVRELGPDELCGMLDDVRCAIPPPNADEDEGEEDQREQARCVINLHREFAHYYKERMRREPLPRLAEQGQLPAGVEAGEVVMGERGAVARIREALQTGDMKDPELRVEVYRSMRVIREAMLLGISEQWTKTMLQTLQSAEQALKDAPLEGLSASALWNDSLHLVSSTVLADAHRGADAFALAQAGPDHCDRAMLRVAIDAAFDERVVEVVRHKVANLMLAHLRMPPGGRVRVLRIEAGFSSDSDVEPSQTLAHVLVQTAPGRPSKGVRFGSDLASRIESQDGAAEHEGDNPALEACRDWIDSFNDRSSTLSSIARGRYNLSSARILNTSTFLQIVFLRPNSAPGQTERLLRFTGKWRPVLEQCSPGLSPEDVTEALRELWVRQMLREDLASAMELPRDKIRVLVLGKCGARALVELVSEEGSIPEAELFKAGRKLQETAQRGESVYEGGELVRVYEYLLDVSISRGYMPPRLPGEWTTAKIAVCSSGPDMHAERRVMSTLVLPALKKTLIPHRIELEWTDLRYGGAAQAADGAEVPLGQRIRSREGCRMELLNGDFMPLMVAMMPSKVFSTRWAEVEVVDEFSGFDITVWSGDVTETLGHERPAGYEYPLMQASVSLTSGKYAMHDLAAHVTYAVNSAKWKGIPTLNEDLALDPDLLDPSETNLSEASTDLSRRFRLPFAWQCSFNRNARMTCWIQAPIFYRFKLTFRHPGLPRVLGLHTDEDFVVCSSPPERHSQLGGVWVSSVTASASWEWSEERKRCAVEHPETIQEPLSRLSNSVAELARPMVMLDFSAEATLLVRDDSLERDKLLSQYLASGVVPHSMVHVLRGQQQQDDVLASREFQELVRRGPRERTGCCHDYSVTFRAFEYSRGIQSKIWALRDLAGSSMADDAMGLRPEVEDARRRCLSWWRLIVEEYENKARFCPHGSTSSVCEDASCARLRTLAKDAELIQWEKEETRRREAAGMQPIQYGEMDAAAFGLTLHLEGFGKTAWGALLSSLASVCPAMAEEGVGNAEKRSSVSMPFHSHLLRRASQVESQRSLCRDFLRPIGGSRDRVFVELERNTTGPPASAPPLIFVRGPPHSGRSSCVAAFLRDATRCAAHHEVARHFASSQFASHYLTGDPSVVAFYFRHDGCSLASVYKYLATEIALQSEGVDALQGLRTPENPLVNLLSTSIDQLADNAERHFVGEAAQALERGAKILLVIDGLEEGEQQRVGRTVLALHSKVVVLQQQLRRHESDPSIQCILTASDTDEALLKEARQVEIAPLTEVERVGICKHWLKRFRAEEMETAEVQCSIDAQAECIVPKTESYLPLFLVACAHQAALFADTDMMHRTSDSAGKIPRASAVCDYVRSLPDTVTSIWADTVLANAEAKYGKLTVQWMLLHILNAPEGVSKSDLQGFVRASLRSVYTWEEKDKGLRKIMLVGPTSEPRFIINIENNKVIWDHRRNFKSEARPILQTMAPIEGTVWCTDAEVEGVLSVLSPFLMRDLRSNGSCGPSGRICLKHRRLRLIAAYRYDNPGSVRSVTEQPKTGVSVGLMWDSFLGEDVMSLLRKEGRRQVVQSDSGPVMADSLLPFVQSAMRGEDVNSFFRSLDDNSVWHLHRFAEVLALFPGLKVSRAAFRPRMARRTLLLDRFLHDRDLLGLFDGGTKKGVFGFEGIELAGKGVRLELRGVKDDVVFGEQCIAIAADDPHGPRIPASFADSEADLTDPLRMLTCNYICRTTPLANWFGGEVSGYSVSMDVCLEDGADQFLITGGNGDPNREQYNQLRGRMVPDVDKAGVYTHHGDQLRVERRVIGHESQPFKILDDKSGQAVWQLSKPWFSLRVGDGYILKVLLKQGLSEGLKQTARAKIQQTCTECCGTPHGKPGQEAMILAWRVEGDEYELHFFDRWDYVAAHTQLTRLANVEVLERDHDTAPLVLAALVRCASVKTDDNNRVLYPPGSDFRVWTYSFELRPPASLSQQQWCSVAACVDQRWGVAVYVDGVLVGNRMLPEETTIVVDPADSRMSLSSYSSAGTFSGYVKNLAVYSRGLSVMEAQAMTTRRGVKAQAPKYQSGNIELADKTKPLATPRAVGLGRRLTYIELVQDIRPDGYWPLQETDGLECQDCKDPEDLEDGRAMRTPFHMLYESRHSGGLIKADAGPVVQQQGEGAKSVLFQGGAIRGQEGGLCRWQKAKDQRTVTLRPVDTDLTNFTFEVWLRRTVLHFNQNETILSIDNEMKQMQGGMWWYLEPNGAINVAIGHHDRTVGPCPVGAIKDLQWHHLAVSRTADPEIINNWSFYFDGRLAWSTRHEAAPKIVPHLSMLLGKRHGEHWGGKRGWKPAVGDPTCFQGNLCHVVFYRSAISPSVIEQHHNHALALDVPPKTPHVETSKVEAEQASERSAALVEWKSRKQVESQVIRRAEQTAARHRPMVWSKSVTYTPSDVNSFYADLENNPVWKMTRRVFTSTNAPDRPLAETCSGPPALDLHVAPGPSSSAPRHKLETSHRVAADVLFDAADPGRSGFWELATPYVLMELPRHILAGRRWDLLEPVLCNLSFLAQTLQLCGPDNLCLLFGIALDALAESEEQSDVTAAAKAQMALHQDFCFSLRDSVRSTGTGCSCHLLCRQAMQAKLSGFERMTAALNTTLTQARRTLAQPVSLEVVPTEISLARCCRKLETVRALGLHICVADYRAVSQILGEWQTWRENNVVSPEAQERRFRSFAEYREGQMAVDNAALLIAAVRPPGSPSFVRALLPFHLTTAGSAHSLRTLLVAALSEVGRGQEDASMAHVVRVEPLYVQDDERYDGPWKTKATVVHVACSAEQVEAVQTALLGLQDHAAVWVEEMSDLSSFLQIWLVPSADSANTTLETVLSSLRTEFKATVQISVSAHVVSVSPARTHFVVELVTKDGRPASEEASEQACQALKSELAHPSEQFLKGKWTKHVLGVTLSRSRMPPGPVGDWSSVWMVVSSSLPDLVSEREVLNRLVLPALHRIAIGRKACFAWADLRFGGPEQNDAEDRIGLIGPLEQLDRSVVQLPGDWMSIPFAINLVGQNRGWVPGEDDMEVLALQRVLQWPGPVAGTTPLEMELWSMAEGKTGRTWEGFVAVRGQRLLKTRKFIELPVSVQKAMQEDHSDRRAERSVQSFREAVIDTAGARCVQFDAKVADFKLQAKVVLNKVWNLKEVLELELESLRGWHEAGQDYTRPEHKHRISGLLRVRADALTIRHRKAVGRCKSEIMGWWLLLKEELARSGGEIGMDPRNGPVSMADLQRTVSDPFFQEMDGAVSTGDVVGILDDDGFTCPAVGNACVSAHSLSLDLGQFARKMLQGLMSLVDARFPEQDVAEVPVHTHLVLANTQRLLCARFASEWSGAVCEVGRHVVPEDGQTVVATKNPNKGIGVVFQEPAGWGVEWLAGLKVDKKKVVRDYRVWDEKFGKGYLAGDGQPSHLESYGPICLAPIRTQALLELERFCSMEELEWRPLSVLAGEACSGRSVLLARLLSQRMKHQPVLPGITVTKGVGRLLTTFFFCACGFGKLRDVYTFLADDIWMRVRQGRGSMDGYRSEFNTGLMERDGAGADGVAKRRFLSALVEAFTSGSDGYDVVVVVDGLSEADVTDFGQTIVAFERQVLRDLRRLTGKHRTLKAILSCLQVPKSLRPWLSEETVISLHSLSSSDRTSLIHHCCVTRQRGWNQAAKAHPSKEQVAQISGKEGAGNALFTALLCRASRFYSVDPNAAVVLHESPAELVGYFRDSVLQRLEVVHGRECVQAMVMQLLAHPRGLSRGDLKSLVREILRRELGPGGGGAGGREPGADMELEGILEGLDVVLAPRLEREGWVHLEHETLRLAAWRRYDAMGAPAEGKVDTEEEEGQARLKKKRGEEDRDGYCWVRAKVFSIPSAAMQIQAEFLVPSSCPLSVASHPRYHVRKLQLPAAARVVRSHVEEEDTVQEEEQLARPGWVANTPKGLGQAWPFVGEELEPGEQMLLSQAQHPDDASHLRANISRGFPVVAEKRYALTQHSAQARFRSQSKTQDRWTRTGGINPGQPHGFYPPRRHNPTPPKPGKPVQAKTMAAQWGNPAAAPALYPAPPRFLGPTLRESTSHAHVPTADGDDRGVQARMQGYSRSRVHAMLGLSQRTVAGGGGAARGGESEDGAMGRQRFSLRKSRGSGR